MGQSRSQSLKSISKSKTTYDDIDELFLAYLKDSVYIRADVYKSPLS